MNNVHSIAEGDLLLVLSRVPARTQLDEEH